MSGKMKILFLCTGNSCRSQMAEGWASHLKGDEFDAYSAGIKAHGLNPRAVAVMKEAGVDISGQRSKVVTELSGIEFDHIVSLCGDAADTCPFFPGQPTTTHVGFVDPVRAEGNEEEIMAVFRRVRDEIRAFVESLPGDSNSLGEKPSLAC